MVLGSHVILSAYGFWLPNDPRGSWSDFVGSWELARWGRATITDWRQSLAGRPHDRQVRFDAKGALKHPPVRFTGPQIQAIGRGFADFAAKSGLVVWACAILPDHAHLVIASHRYTVEQVAILLKGAATRQLLAEGLHPLANVQVRGDRQTKLWARGFWKVFLNAPHHVRCAIRYVESKPLKMGLPDQSWPFVRPYDP